MTVVAGLAASWLRKLCMAFGERVASGAMVSNPDVRTPLLWCLPWTVSCLGTVLNALSALDSYVTPRFAWIPGWVTIPKRIGPVPVGGTPLVSVLVQSRPSMVWFAVTPLIYVSAWRPGRDTAELTASVLRWITAVTWRVAVPKVPVAVRMTTPLVSAYLPTPSTGWPVRIWSPA